MKLLILAETLTPGGAENFVVRLANALSAEHEVIVAVVNGHAVHPGVRSQLEPKVRLEMLHIRAFRSLWRSERILRALGIDWSMLRRIQRRWLTHLVEQERPQAIHSHLMPTDYLVSTLPVRGFRHIVTLHGDYGPYRKRQIVAHMRNVNEKMRAALASADGIVGISQDHLLEIRRHYADRSQKLHLIYNGYDLPPLLEAPRPKELWGKFVFGLVGRGIEEKGWAEAIAAFDALNRDDAALVLVGDGRAIDRLRRQELPPGVLFAGYSSQAIGWIRHFDVGLLPTRLPAESLPTVVIEYLACGKPVIATDIGEIGAMMTPSGEEEPAGRLLPFDGARICVGDLIAAMQQMIDDEGFRKRAAAAALRASERFDMGRCIREYLELYSPP